MLELDQLKFDEKGLIPAIVIDTNTKQVLMLAYMNAESLRISMEEGRTCFWSRSRQSLWRKGETSGNIQHIVSITADCDADSLLVEVKPDGPACHTGSESCFFQPVFAGETAHFPLHLGHHRDEARLALELKAKDNPQLRCDLPAAGQISIAEAYIQIDENQGFAEGQIAHVFERAP